MSGNGQHRPVYTTTKTRAVAALAVKAVTRGDTHARHDIEQIAPELDYDTLMLTVEIVAQMLGEMLNFRTLHRVYFEEPRT